NGMDMSMDGAMELTPSNMVPYLHLTPFGDTLWFQGWVPTGAGAVIGACIALFLLGIFERWLAASRAMAESAWGRSAQLAMLEKLNRSKDTTPTDKKPKLRMIMTLRGRHVPPFMPAHDIARGILHVAQTAVGFLFMLAVMTFQVAYIASICVGVGIGEIMFGRYI
ncbi:hypothetical protein AMATHDRAFT_115099, partial [Amanita thiersii Skay4041]